MYTRLESGFTHSVNAVEAKMTVRSLAAWLDVGKLLLGRMPSGSWVKKMDLGTVRARTKRVTLYLV